MVSLRTIHPDTDAALDEPVYRPLVLVEMHFDSGVVRAHSGVGDFPLSGNVFKGVSWLGKVSDWQEAEGLQAYGIELELSQVEKALVAISLGEHYRGRPLLIWIAFLDENGQLVGAPVGPWRWRMSTLDGEFGDPKGSLVLRAGSRMAMWERANPRRWTDEDQRAKYPDDYGCEFVSAAAEKGIEF